MGWMSALLAVILVSTIVIVTLGWTYLLLTLWALRHRFEIAVRCPLISIVVQITCLVLVLSVLLQWLLLIVDESLPCFVVYWVSFAAIAFAVMPYVIRAARLVIAFSRRRRKKYARFVKNTIVMRVSAAVIVALFVRAAIFFGDKPEHYSRNAHDCFYVDDTVLVANICVFVGPPAVVLAVGLSKLDDAFMIREELMGTIIIGYVIQGVQILVIFKVVPDTPRAHIIVEILQLLFGVNSGVWGLLIPMVRAHRDGLRARFRGNIVPVENVDGAEAAESTAGVLTLATKGGEMADKFDIFCKKHLCQESWDFIVDATRYENMAVDDSDEQHSAFLHVLDHYLLPTSPNEVNISYASSKRMASFRTSESFFRLDDEERRRVLHRPLGEIVQMLEENLLSKFWSHVAKEKDDQISELAGGDDELMKIMRASAYSSFRTPSGRN